MRRVRFIIGLSLLSLASVSAVSVAPGLDRAEAHARPLTVRARSRVAVELDRRTDEVALRGQLRDDRGQAIPGEAVSLDIPGYPSQIVSTGLSGTFEIVIGARDLALLEAMHGQRIPWRLSFGGDHSFGDAAASGALDLRRQTTHLAVAVAPEVVGLDESEVEVTLALSSRKLPIADAELRLQVGDGEELSAHTGDDGRATFLIKAGLLGSAGRYRVRGRFLGDQLFAPSEGEGSLRALLKARVTLRVGREGDPRQGRYRFSGRLADAEGPIPDALVALIARPAGGSSLDLSGQIEPRSVVAVTTTRADGVYLTAVAGPELLAGRQGALELRAIYSPNDRAHLAALSRPVRVPVPPPPGVPIHFYLAGLGAVVLLLAGIQLVRTGALSLLRARLQVWLGSSPIPPAEPLAPTEPAFIQTHTTPSPVPRRSAIAGVVVDGHTLAPIPGAVIALTGPRGAALHAVADRRGGLDLPDLPDGPHQLKISAPGYLPRGLTTPIPHDGALDGARFALVSVRRRLLDSYLRALSAAGGALVWGVDTPREALASARRHGERAELALHELRRLVERAWFAEIPATPEDARRAALLLATVEEGL